MNVNDIQKLLIYPSKNEHKAQKMMGETQSLIDKTKGNSMPNKQKQPI